MYHYVIPEEKKNNNIYWGLNRHNEIRINLTNYSLSCGNFFQCNPYLHSPSTNSNASKVGLLDTFEDYIHKSTVVVREILQGKCSIAKKTSCLPDISIQGCVLLKFCGEVLIFSTGFLTIQLQTPFKSLSSEKGYYKKENKDHKANRQTERQFNALTSLKLALSIFFNPLCSLHQSYHKRYVPAMVLLSARASAHVAS